MVSKPRPNIKYTAQQVEAMRQAYPDFMMPGYVLRIDADGMTSFVPSHRAAYGGSYDPNRPEENTPLPAYRVGWDEDPFPVDPIRKRTPQQRLDSMQERLHQNWKESGGIPGLPEAEIRRLVGESWKKGTPMTADQIRTAAATLLGQAETKFEASEAKKIVRTSPTD